MYHPLIGTHALARLRPVTWSHERPTPDRRLLAIPTHCGVYFLPPALSCLQALLQEEMLTPGDLDRAHHHFKSFRRELYLLAAREELSQSPDFTVRRFTAELRRSEDNG